MILIEKLSPVVAALRPVFLWCAIESLRAHYASVADDGVQWHIPGRCRQACHVLTLVGQTDQSRARAGALGKGQAAIIETASHAHTLALFIKADQGQQNQVQSPAGQTTGTMRAMAGIRLGNAETVAPHGGTGMVTHEPQAVV